MIVCLAACTIGCSSVTYNVTTSDADDTQNVETQEDQSSDDELSEDQNEEENKALADDQGNTVEDMETDNIGITFHLPEQYANPIGVINFYDMDLSDDDGIYIGEMDYIGIPKDEYEEIFAGGDVSDEDSKRYNDNAVALAVILAITRDRGPADIVEFFKEDYGEDVDEDEMVLIAQADDCHFYQYMLEDQSNYDNLGDEFKAEYDELFSLKDDLLKNATYTKPSSLFDRVAGQKVSFTTTDFDGNTVNSEDIFAQNEITMINVWATWCGWCIKELPDLEKINKNLASKNCAIIGLCGDADDPAAFKDAQELLKENGVTYLNIKPYDGWEDVFDMTNGWPTSFFVDKNGEMIAAPIIGAAPDRYEEHIDEALKGNGEATAEKNTSYKNSDNLYRIKVVDETSDPVPGAMVQFCTDDTCKMAETDSDGTVTFDDPEGVYTVHILKVPKGYKENKTEYKTEDYYSDLVIVVDKE